jgi:hypothetical protein
MAKTHLSLSPRPRTHGRAEDGDCRCATCGTRQVRVRYALCGDIMAMPGLPAIPRGVNVDIDAEGNAVGCSSIDGTVRRTAGGLETSVCNRGETCRITERSGR